MNRKRVTILLAVLMFSLACAKKKPVMPLSQFEQFARVYTGYLSICMSDTARVEQRAAYLQRELDQNLMSRAEFEQIRQRLEADPRAFIDLLNRIESGLKVTPAKKSPPPKEKPVGKAVPIVP